MFVMRKCYSMGEKKGRELIYSLMDMFVIYVVSET